MSEMNPVPEQAQPVEQSDKDARLWATLCHLAALAGFIGIPLGWVLGPLIIWLIKRNDFAFVDRHGKEALNFQISMTIYGFVCFLLVFVLIGIPLLLAAGILDIVFTIVAAVKANNGEDYRYPLSIRFIH